MAKSGPRTVRRYTDHFKRTAVGLSRLDGVAVSDVAESLYIYPYMLSRWRKEASEDVLLMKGKEVNVDKDTSSELNELREIKRDHERLKVEHNLLKKQVSSLLLQIKHLCLIQLPPRNTLGEPHVPTLRRDTSWLLSMAR